MNPKALSLFRHGLFSASIIAAIVSPARGQTDLADFLKKRTWDPVLSGPRIVLEPTKVISKQPAKVLQDFDRAVFRAGGVTVIAPTEMVLIDDTFSEPPNFYDGIERYAKVLYLMTLLNDPQWSMVTTDGLSMNDLKGEARLVLQSILPKPLHWTAVKVAADGIQYSDADSGTVPESQLSQVKLRLSRGLAFQVNLAGQANTYTGQSTNMRVGWPGETVYKLEWKDRGYGPNPFGSQARKEAPNKSKLSQLPYDSPSLDAKISLPSSETIDQALQQVQDATGIELHSDLRVSDRGLSIEGQSCRAGDLLQAIALTVTGTYRKVGPAYELTSDLEGIGGRKLKFAKWEALAHRELNRRTTQWRLAIGNGGHLSQIHFPSGGRFAPNDAMSAELAKREKILSMEMVPTAAMTPAVKEFLDYINTVYKTQPIDTSKAMINANLEYGFVLPNGQALSPDDGLGYPALFFEQPKANYEYPKASPPPYSLVRSGEQRPRRPAMIQAGDAESVAMQIDLLGKFGFYEVWLEATRADVLKAAIDACKAKGMSLRLLIRPWALPEDHRSDDEDSTILGDHGDQLLDRERSMEEWTRWITEQPAYTMTPYRSICPTGGSTFSRWASFAQLARTPGVTGVVVDDLQLFGYEKQHVDYEHSDLEKPFGELSDFGYSVNQRLAFLRERSLDPIDTIGQRLNFRTAIQQPFFPDNATMWADGQDDPSTALKDLAKTWDQFRSTAFEKASHALLEALPSDLPAGILVSPVRQGINDRAIPSAPFQAWPIPANESTIGDVYRFRPDGQEDASYLPYRTLGLVLNAAAPIALDFRAVKLSDLASVLDHSLRRVIKIRTEYIDRG